MGLPKKRSGVMQTFEKWGLPVYALAFSHGQCCSEVSPALVYISVVEDVLIV